MPPWAVGNFQDIVSAVTSTTQESPLLVGAVLVGLVVLVLGVRWLVGSLRSSPPERLLDTLTEYGHLSILMHPNPDPDAMSSALGVSTLATSVGTETTIQYSGQIRHQENRAFETVLDVDFNQIDEASELDGDGVVLVDHNEARGFPGADGIEPVAVIDHHPGSGEGSQFTDVREEYGACATVFAEYFETLGLKLVDPDDPETENGTGNSPTGKSVPVQVSTGLLYGIQSDTKQLTKGCSPADFHAAEYLYAGIDEDRLDRIANPQVDAEVLDVKARAITSRTVHNAFAVSDVGSVSNVDAIPQAADELMKLEGVTAVVVLGEKAGTLHLSGRSRDDRVHMGKILDTSVDDIPMASAGGHARMGGGQLSIDHMQGLGPSKGLPRTEFKDRLFEAMAGDV